MRTVRIGQRTLRVDDDQPTFWDRVENGSWEPNTLATLDRILGPGSTFLDLGAWVGALSLCAAGNGARVLAVEADPAALRQLDRNMAANPELAARIEILRGAVSARPGPVRLGSRRKPGNSMSSVLLASREGSWSAQAITPDDLAGQLGEARDLVVKIDIEGGEYDLLPAMAPILARACAVLVAFHPEMLEASGDADVLARERLALEPLTGWTARRIDGPDAPAREGVPLRGEWLFRR